MVWSVAGISKVLIYKKYHTCVVLVVVALAIAWAGRGGGFAGTWNTGW